MSGARPCQKQPGGGNRGLGSRCWQGLAAGGRDAPRAHPEFQLRPGSQRNWDLIAAGVQSATSGDMAVTTAASLMAVLEIALAAEPWRRGEARIQSGDPHSTDLAVAAALY